MSAPIPSNILRSTAVVEWCTGTDVYQNQTYASETVRHVHIQPTSAIVKTVSNTDCQLRSLLFVDARRSVPALDWAGLLCAAHERGGDMRVIIRGVTYTVMTADALRDERDVLHHWEIGVV